MSSVLATSTPRGADWVVLLEPPTRGTVASSIATLAPVSTEERRSWSTSIAARWLPARALVWIGRLPAGSQLMESRSYSWGDDINKLDEVAAQIRDGGGRADVARITSLRSTRS